MGVFNMLLFIGLLLVICFLLGGGVSYTLNTSDHSLLSGMSRFGKAVSKHISEVLNKFNSQPSYVCELLEDNPYVTCIVPILTKHFNSVIYLSGQVYKEFIQLTCNVQNFTNVPLQVIQQEIRQALHQLDTVPLSSIYVRVVYCESTNIIRVIFTYYEIGKPMIHNIVSQLELSMNNSYANDDQINID